MCGINRQLRKLNYESQSRFPSFETCNSTEGRLRLWRAGKSGAVVGRECTTGEKDC